MNFTEIKFEGIDYWNRPVFKDINSDRRYGSVTRLFNGNAPEQQIKECIDADALLYFGRTFGCEPDGSSPIKPLKILW